VVKSRIESPPDVPCPNLGIVLQTRACRRSAADIVQAATAEAWRSASETEAGDAQQGEKKSDDGREALYPALELVDLGQEDLAVLLEGLDGDDRPRTTLVPGGDRGAGDLKVAVQRTDAGATHLLAEPVGVRAAPPGIGARDHRGTASMLDAGRRATASRPDS
jgi:hypothetical protein